MRINHANTMSGLNISINHLLEHFRLTHACFTNNIHMPTTVISFNTKQSATIAVIGLRKYRNFSGLIHIIQMANYWVVLIYRQCTHYPAPRSRVQQMAQTTEERFSSIPFFVPYDE